MCYSKELSNSNAMGHTVCVFSSVVRFIEKNVIAIGFLHSSTHDCSYSKENCAHMSQNIRLHLFISYYFSNVCVTFWGNLQ